MLSVKGGGGGSIKVLNGIIEEYKATTDEISANTFVEKVMVNTISNISTETLSSMSTCKAITATKLSESKVFITYSTGTSYPLYARILEFIDGEITLGDEITILSKLDDGNSSSIIQVSCISENKVFMVYRGSSSCLSGVVCTIDGMVITKGSETTLYEGGYDYGTRIATIDDNKVFITFSASLASSYLYAIVCTISGTTITAGTAIQLSTNTNSGKHVSVVTLSKDKVFIAHSYAGSSYTNLYGMVCTISGTTITAGTDKKISSPSVSIFYIRAVALSDDTVFISYGYNTNYYLYAIVCTISGTTITAGTGTALSSVNYSGLSSFPIKVSKDKVLVIHLDESFYLCATVCNISTRTISKGSAYTLVSANSCSRADFDLAGAVLNSVLLITHGYAGLFATTCIPDGDTIKQSTTVIHGLSKTKATATTKGQVWMLA